MTVALEVNHVWKKFFRGEFNDSLRDAIPALCKSLVGLGPNREELQKGDFWSLKDVDFKVEEGETVALIGHNGAGKSTMLKILSKILKPNRGSIKANGKLRALIEVGSGFHGDLTGRENIFLNGSILGMTHKEIEAKFDEIVDFSGIEDFLDMPVKRYSSGMFARLGFAVAAHLEPDILIVDEVLSVGDTAFQKKCLGKMNSVAQEGRTVLFVSHNMAAVRNLCQRAILLDHGEMIDDGNTECVVEKYYEKLKFVHYDLNTKCRTKNQKAFVSHIQFGSSCNTLSEEGSCDCNGPLYVRVFYKVNHTIDNCFFCIDFIDNQENHLVGLSTNITEKQIGSLTQDGYVDFYIPHFPLTGGVYSIAVAIFERKSHLSYGERVDHVLYERCIKVEKVNIPGWRFQETYNQKCFIPYEWNNNYI